MRGREDKEGQGRREARGRKDKKDLKIGNEWRAQKGEEGGSRESYNPHSIPTGHFSH